MSEWTNNIEFIGIYIVFSKDSRRERVRVGKVCKETEEIYYYYSANDSIVAFVFIFHVMMYYCIEACLSTPMMSCCCYIQVVPSKPRYQTVRRPLLSSPPQN
jgi:hypothetical protein